VTALREDTLWAESLPGFIRKTLEVQKRGFGRQVALKEREIVILTEEQSELKRDLRNFKADYFSADAEDVIRALRKRQRGLNEQVRYLERQLELAQQSSNVEGGAIEVLEGLLRERDTDKQLVHGLGLKSLEIGLKIGLLETDAGGKTVEVSRMGQKEQQAVAHLRGRLVKERGIVDARRKTVEAELERSLPHGMRAFERVSRTIQRLCNGYTSLPGLVEWGRLTAARLETTTTAVGDRRGLGGDGRWGGRVDGTAIATADPRPAYGGGGGARHDRRAVNDRAAEGQGPWSVAGLCDSRNFAAPSSAHFDGAGSLSERGVFDFGARISATTAASSLWSSPSTASTASLPGRPRNAMLPSSSHPTKETTHYSPKKTSGVGGRHNQEGRAEGTRYSLKTAGAADSGGQRGGGIFCDADYGGGGGSGGGGSVLSGLAGFHSGGGKGGSSVASLLREERAFQRRTSAHQGSRETEEGLARGHADTFRSLNRHHGGSVPSLVPLNNVGLPVRLRQQ
ncbi:unnamed protein product, partial [Ectocarpus sp. 13 AM-2016]